jgi:MFS family permease
MMTRTVRLDGQDAGDLAKGVVRMTANQTVSPQHASEPTIGSLVADAHTSFSTLLHGEIELAKLEVKASVKNAGTGAGMFIAAAIMLIFSLTFGLIALAEGLVALHLWRWVAYLIVFGFLVLLAGLLVFLGVKKVKRVKAPKETIETTKSTVAALKQATTHP